MEAAYLILFLFFLVNLCEVFCFPNGPPTTVCFTKLPLHKDKKTGEVIPPQTSPPPFKIIVNTTSYKPGDVINIKVDSDTAEPFKGLFLQVRPVKKSKNDKVRGVPLGMYRRVLENTKIIGCDIAVDTIVHKDPYVKYTTEMNWISPLLMKNDVIVRATILANFSTYWTNLKSDVIRLQDVGPLPVEGLKDPWLKEIISTVQKKDDKKAMEDAVRARFEKGLNGALDPNGNVMVHYVVELLPFEDSTKHGRPEPPPGFDAEDLSDTGNGQTTQVFETTTVADTLDSVTRPDGTVHFPESATENKDDDANEKEVPKLKDSLKQLYQSKAEAYYEVLVKAVLGGDKIVADALQKIIE